MTAIERLRRWEHALPRAARARAVDAKSEHRDEATGLRRCKRTFVVEAATNLFAAVLAVVAERVGCVEAARHVARANEAVVLTGQCFAASCVAALAVETVRVVEAAAQADEVRGAAAVVDAIANAVDAILVSVALVLEVGWRHATLRRIVGRLAEARVHALRMISTLAERLAFTLSFALARVEEAAEEVAVVVDGAHGVRRALDARAAVSVLAFTLAFAFTFALALADGSARTREQERQQSDRKNAHASSVAADPQITTVVPSRACAS
jgi:hypothetical protein